MIIKIISIEEFVQLNLLLQMKKLRLNFYLESFPKISLKNSSTSINNKDVATVVMIQNFCFRYVFRIKL